MRKLSADYIFPISQSPIFNGIVILNNDNVIIDTVDPAKINYEIQDIERFKGFICPGFINTHCHLELSYLKGKILEKKGLHEFILSVQQLRKEKFNIIEETLILADKEMINNGIKGVGDISNNNISFLAKKNSPIIYHTFIEVFGSNPEFAGQIFNHAIKLAEEYNIDKAISIVPHSPYSVSKELFEKIKEYAEEKKSILCMHNQENEDENEYFRNREGMIEKRMKILGINDVYFKSTGINSLPSVAAHLPKENPILFVHNTVSNTDDIAFAIKNFKNPWWCFCPNSNLYIENKLPDFNIFLKNENNITIGTDSLASNSSLSILEELKTIHFNIPSIDLNTLFKWGTYNGAVFLNMEKNLGSIEKGKNPGINLIENVDLMKVQLTKLSSVKVLV